MEETNRLTIERKITGVMLDLGVPAHLNGFRYLREAVLACMADAEVVSSVTKLLYPDLAKKFATTAQKVERAIRNAIEASWNRGNRDTFEVLFGYTCEDGKNRPTNSEYIACIADRVALELRDKSMLLATIGR